MHRTHPRYGRGVVVLDEHDSSLGMVQGTYELKATLLRLFRSPDYKPPLLPAVALELHHLVRRPSVTVPQVTALLGHDPMLAGQLLRISQSAMYSRGEPVRTLDDVILRLGLGRVSDLFLRASLETKIFRVPGYEVVMEALRRHSIFTAEVSRLVCRQTLGFDEYAFLCGLLHDVGIAACVLSLQQIGKDPVKFEGAWPAIREIHESCSEMLAKVWSLPTDLALVLSLHHSANQGGRIHPLAAAVAMADVLAEEVGFGFSQEADSGASEAYATALSLDAGALAKLREEVALLATKFDQ